MYLKGAWINLLLRYIFGFPMNSFTDLSKVGRFFDCGEFPKIPVKKIAVDSRAVQPGDLFFALPGEKNDGHDFIPEAVSRGASGAVVAKGITAEVSMPLIEVPDTLHALQSLTQAELKGRPTKIIGVTGSVGKTTTKEMIAALLGGKYRAICSPGNFNSQIGLPLTIFNHTTGDEDYLVLEMGMTHKGHIARLIDIAPPLYSVITHVALVHAANFNSIDEIASAKAEIFSHPQTRRGFYPETIACAQLIQNTGTCAKFAVPMQNDRYPPLPFNGEHLRQNFLLAAAVAVECGVAENEIIERMKLIKLPEKRQEYVAKNEMLFVNDSYNASVPSMIAALRALPSPVRNGKRIAVLGEMLELGSFSEECHRQVAIEALDKVDYMLCLGPECKAMIPIWAKSGRQAYYFDERQSLVEALKCLARPGDVILLKGSHAKQLWKVLDEV